MKTNRLDNDPAVLDQPPDDGSLVHAITSSVEDHLDVSTSPADEVLPEGESLSPFFLSVDREVGSTPTSPVRRFGDSSTAESTSTADTSASSGTSKNWMTILAKEPFTAHRDLLVKSPKLDAQCNGNFPEAGSRRTILEDHDHRIFVLLLEYLYRGDYYPFTGQEFGTSNTEDEDTRATQLQRKGDLCCMAEYYQLNELQQLAVRKMKMLTPITFESFLSVSEHVYCDSGSSGPFRAYYFGEQILETTPLAAHKGWLLDVVAKGGDLAQDLFLSGKGLPKAKAVDERIDECAVMDIETAFDGFVGKMYALEAYQSEPLTLPPPANSFSIKPPVPIPISIQANPKPQIPTSGKQAHPTLSPSSTTTDPISEVGIPILKYMHPTPISFPPTRFSATGIYIPPPMADSPPLPSPPLASATDLAPHGAGSRIGDRNYPLSDLA
ncbi:hypothetical protein G7Y79_00020g047980 [Physcia stellaris]|nr:hypothetical protein G7Y79_00020g047980 [Physcia stellaris]